MNINISTKFKIGDIVTFKTYGHVYFVYDIKILALESEVTYILNNRNDQFLNADESEIFYVSDGFLDIVIKSKKEELLLEVEERVKEFEFEVLKEIEEIKCKLQ